MKKLILLLVLAVALLGCASEDKQADVEATKPEPVDVAAAPKTLEIEWQRMVDEDGQACCGADATQKALMAAHAQLTEVLGPQGIEVIVKHSEFSPQECAGRPERTNRVLVAGYGIEHWLDAEVGASPCEGFCKQALGDEGTCKTLIYEGETYEVVPAEFIVKAGLLAAAHHGSGTKCSGCPRKGACGGHAATCDGSCGGACQTHGGCKASGVKCDGSCGCPEGTCDGTCQGHGACKASSAKPSGCPKANRCSGGVCTSGG